MTSTNGERPPPSIVGADTQRRETDGPTIEFDYSAYAAYLSDTELSEDQKQEFLLTLWNLLLTFVDLGFGVHPLQQIDPKSRGQNEERFDELSGLSACVLDSPDRLLTEEVAGKETLGRGGEI